MSDIRDVFTKGKSRAHERLDAEDDEGRQRRMHDMFMHLDAKSAPHPREVPRSFDFGDRRTFKVEPPAELLSRIQAFLPEFAASTAEIARRAQEDPDSVDIEKLNNKARYIKMDLGLGVFEERKGTASSSTRGSDTDMTTEPDAQNTSSDSGTSGSHSDSDSSDGYDSDSSVDIISSTLSTFAYERPIRPLPRRVSTRPDIVVLSEGDFATAKDTGSPSSAGRSPV